MHHIDWITSTPRLEPVDYIKKPQVIVRCIVSVLSVIIFAVLHNNCSYLGRCAFMDDNSACGYGLFLSTATLLLCTVFLLLDIWVDNISNCNIRKTVILTDYFLSGVWTFLWFVGFCMFCNRWQYTTDKILEDVAVGPTGPRVVITFSFFSLCTLAVLVYLCNLAYTAVRLMVADVSNFDEYPTPGPQNPYHGFTPDSDMLDPGQPAQLASDASPPYGVQRFDTSPNATAGRFVAQPMQGYQP